MKLTSIKIRFGSISLSKAKNIQILYKGFEIQIEEIALKSNFFNSAICNPVQIFIKDVRINKNIETSDENELINNKTSKSTSNEPIKQIPSFLVTFLQVCFSLIISMIHLVYCFFFKLIFSLRECVSQTFHLCC